MNRPLVSISHSGAEANQSAKALPNALQLATRRIGIRLQDETRFNSYAATALRAVGRTREGSVGGYSAASSLASSRSSGSGQENISNLAHGQPLPGHRLPPRSRISREVERTAPYIRSSSTLPTRSTTTRWHLKLAAMTVHPSGRHASESMDGMGRNQQKLGSVLSRAATGVVDPTVTGEYQGLNFYGSYNPASETDRELHRWATAGFLRHFNGRGRNLVPEGGI